MMWVLGPGITQPQASMKPTYNTMVGVVVFGPQTYQRKRGGVRSTTRVGNPYAIAEAGSPQADGSEALVVRFPSLPSAGAMVLGPCTARGTHRLIR